MKEMKDMDMNTITDHPSAGAEPVPVVVLPVGGRGGGGARPGVGNVGVQRQTAPGTGRWASDLYDCSSREEACWWSCWCPVLVSARTSQLFGFGSSPGYLCFFFCALVLYVLMFLVFGIGAIFLFPVGVCVTRGTMRSRIREERLSIPGSRLEDCCLHTFCCPCALAQEAREAEEHDFPLIDFCSGQVLQVVEEGHEERAEEDAGTTLKGEFSNLSSFSRLILGFSGAVFLLAIALLGDLGSTLVLFLMFVQPCVVLYFVYWKSHRRDAVFDIVVKMFAVGFWWTSIATSLLEGIVMLVYTLLVGLTMGAGEITPDGGDGDGSTPSDAAATFYHDHPVQAVVFVFFSAFIVAATIEETMKHFIVRCCKFHHAPRNQYTIIIYMVAGALGFATFENILYVLQAKKGDLFPHSSVTRFETELFVLTLRLLMPIHPICAFIQGMNTAKRDLEVKNVRLFHILFPAILLHGTFDFVQMLLGVIQAALGIDSPALSMCGIFLGLFITVVSIYCVRQNYRKQEERILNSAVWQRLGDVDDDDDNEEEEEQEEGRAKRRGAAAVAGGGGEGGGFPQRNMM